MSKSNNSLSKIVRVGLLIFLFTGYVGNLSADGLPGEYYVTQRWRDLFAGHSPATNPAFMTEENYLTARMALSPTLQNTFFLIELGAILPIGLYQSAGISYLGLTHETKWHEPIITKGKVTLLLLMKC